MKEDSKMSKRSISIEILREAARRAGWNAVHGPLHLRRGEFRPEGHLPYALMKQDAAKKAET